MKMTYDSEIDALYIELSDEPIANSVDYPSGVTAELGPQGRVIALEILDLHQHLKAAEAALDASIPREAATRAD